MDSMEKQLVFVQGRLSQIKKVFVIWKLGNFCNFKCSYCESKNNSGNVKFAPLAAVKIALDVLAANYTSMQIYFTGGEPTVHQNFKEILEYAASKGFDCSFLSNGSRSVEYFSEIIPSINAKVELTYHVEEGNLANFIKVAALLASHKKLLIVKVPHLPERWDECRAAYETLTKEGFPVLSKVLFKEFRPLKNGENKTYDYTPEQMQQLKTDTKILSKHLSVGYSDGSKGVVNPTELISQNLNRFRGWKCNVGIDTLTIGPLGDVQKGACFQDRYVGNLFDGSFVKPTEPATCEKDVCWCLSDISGSKHKV
jgi:MoaA/NifB/PqqE/SkfB family radical SAM enzyme